MSRESLPLLPAAAILAALGASASGGGPWPAQASSASSYANYKQIGLVPQPLPPGDNTIRAYGRFTGSGRLDLFRAVLTYNAQLPPAQATPSRFEFYARQADGSFTRDTTLLPQTDGCVHPRKALVADFNNDGRPDVFVACHGYDAPPFPGERSKVVLSQSNGAYAISDASSDVGFNHGASAADLSGDGFVDVLVVDNDDPDHAYTLVNDRTGHFLHETASRLPASIRSGLYFSVELVDLDEDGRLDLLLGGHEWEGATTVAFINPGSNDFAAVAPAVIPPVLGEGVVLDFTATGTGSGRTLWVLRTSGGDGTFYQSRVLQKVQYPSLASSVVLSERPATWIPWVIPAVVGGVDVIASDNEADRLSVPQAIGSLGISVGDASVVEGDSGAVPTTFAVSLSKPAADTVSVDYGVAGGTATAGVDFIASQGTLRFPVGTTTRTISVPVLGDRSNEGNETLFVNLSNAVNGTLFRPQGVGTIGDDDAPGFAISDATVVAPLSGPASATFTVTLSPPGSVASTVDFATADGSATAAADYAATAGTLTFLTGETSRTVSIPVNAHAVPGGISTFFVDLSGSSGPAVTRSRGVASIYDRGFYPVVPCRILDTRVAVQGPALSAGSTRTVVVGGRCGVPVGAAAVSLNVTVTAPTAQGNLRLYPASTAPPLVSAINFGPNQTRANNAVLSLSPNGRLSILCGQAAGVVDLVLDVSGYFE